MRFIYFISCLLLSPTLLAMIEGSCADDRLLPQGEVLKEMSFFVLNAKTLFYNQKNGQAIDQVKFGKTIFVEKKEQNWLKTEENGWVHAKDVLCGGEVLRDPKTQLDVKVFPKPETYKEGSTKTVVRAYRTLDSVKKGYGATYQSLSRFKHYYILAKNDDCTNNTPDKEKDKCTYYLLSEFATAEEDKLVGWVVGKRVIPWNTAIAIRPDDDSNTWVRMYHEPSSRIPDSGVIRGGQQWYQKLMHLPVLEKQRLFYKVASPGSFSADLSAFDNKDTQISKVINQFKNLDIFFLIDGTASMQLYINETKRITKQIVNQLKSEYSEASFRLGFLVYRDNYANPNNGGMGENVYFDNNNCQGIGSLDQFTTELDKVYATSNDQDDYPENLFLGLKEASKLMDSCHNRTKLLFVIGNAGDRKRLRDLSEDVKSKLEQFKNFRLFVPFFIRAKVNCSVKTNTQACNVAYRKFNQDAKDFIRYTRPDIKSPSIFGLSVAGLYSKIKDKLQVYANTHKLNEVAQSARVGNSVEDAISIIDDVQYQGELRRILCAELPKQCDKGVYHATTEAYVKMGDKTVEEAWMTYEQLQNWMSVLNPVNSEYKKGQREEMVEKIKQALNLITGAPKNKINKGETISHFIKRVGRGLPLRENSPFTQYTMEEIKGMKRCFPQLREWMNTHLSMLKNVLNNPVAETTFKTGRGCIDNYGKHIPKITITGTETLGKDNTFTYQHQFIDNQTIYWVPMKYLP